MGLLRYISDMNKFYTMVAIYIFNIVLLAYAIIIEYRLDYLKAVLAAAHIVIIIALIELADRFRYIDLPPRNRINLTKILDKVKTVTIDEKDALETAVLEATLKLCCMLNYPDCNTNEGWSRCYRIASSVALSVGKKYKNGCDIRSLIDQEVYNRLGVRPFEEGFFIL